MYKSYKDYFYKDNGTLEFLGKTMIPASLVSLILTIIIPPVGLVLDVITIPTTIITGVIMGTNLAINISHSRKLFKAISKRDISEMERRLGRISKKFDGNKKYIFNCVKDKDDNTLIVSIIKSNINEEKKIELISKMIDNWAYITNILEKNTNDTNNETLIEKITKEKEINNIGVKIKNREKEVETGFHPFKKRAIKSLKRNLENLKKEKEIIKKVKNAMGSKINSMIKEKVSNKRIILNRILNLNENEEFRDKQIQIK